MPSLYTVLCYSLQHVLLLMMLKDRILNVTGHGRARTVSISSSTSSSTSDYFSYRPSKYKDWTEEQMRAAYEAVKDGMSIRRAAEEYGVE